MQKPNKATFPELRVAQSYDEMPPRSRLISLNPISQGTARTEGLNSYIIRLAGAHSVNPRRLIRTEFVAARPEIAQMAVGVFCLRGARTINGYGAYAKAFCQAATQLTGVSNLRYLTLLPLENLLPRNALIARHVQWCPACIAEMAKLHQEAYRPLVWSFLHYQTCSIHQCPLVEHCPECGSLQHVFPKYPSVAHCSQCGAWLGGGGKPAQSDVLDGLWISTAIEDIVACLAQLEADGTTGNFLRSIQLSARRSGDGTRKRFCLETGLKPWAPQEWLSGSRPSFQQWLTVAYGLGIKPSVLVLQPERCREATGVNLRRLPSTLQFVPRKTALSEAGRQQLALELETIAADSEDCRSLTAIARQFLLDPTRLRHWAPEPCKRIQAKYQIAVKLKAEQRQIRDLGKLQMTIDEFIEKDEYPGAGKVNKRLRRQGVALVRPELMQAYREATANWEDRVSIALKPDAP